MKLRSLGRAWKKRSIALTVAAKLFQIRRAAVMIFGGRSVSSLGSCWPCLSIKGFSDDGNSSRRLSLNRDMSHPVKSIGTKYEING